MNFDFSVTPAALFIISAIVILTSVSALAALSSRVSWSSDIETRKTLAWCVVSVYVLIFAMSLSLAYQFVTLDMSLADRYQTIMNGCRAHPRLAASDRKHLTEIREFAELLRARRYDDVARKVVAMQDGVGGGLEGPRHAEIFLNPALRTVVEDHVALARAAVDPARVLYETRSLISYAATIAVAAIGVFLPILVVAWQNARSRLLQELRDLASLKYKVDEADRTRAVTCTRSDLQSLAAFGDLWRGIYWITIAAAALLVCTLVLANVNAMSTYWQYVLGLFLVTFASLFFLWLLVLLWIYHIVVHPYIAIDRYGELLERISP
jgi:hypothetical protein